MKKEQKQKSCQKKSKRIGVAKEEMKGHDLTLEEFESIPIDIDFDK